MNNIARLGDEPLNLSKQLDLAHKAEQESEQFSAPGIYFVVREGKDVIRHRAFPCDLHKLTEEEVKEMAYEFAHTILKIQERKKEVNKKDNAKEENNKKKGS